MEILLRQNTVSHFHDLTNSRGEEVYLVRFFGDEYKDYRKRVGVWIPFIQ
jgi:protein-S-isoprenylcysteine O-methyltransferase Ste14